jgi:Cu-Zn family superoxide dismutase
MKRKTIAIATLVVASSGVFVAATTAAGARNPDAVATLRTADGARAGKVRFYDDNHAGQTVVKVELELTGANTTLADFHGFHVHANDNPANGDGCIADPAAAPSTWFVSADGHLKHEPGETHAGHAGDMPSLYLGKDGRARAQFTLDRIEPSELDNRVVILHAGRDNFGNVPLGTNPDQYSANAPDAVTKTANTGNAGDRYACGVIDLR